MLRWLVRGDEILSIKEEEYCLIMQTNLQDLAFYLVDPNQTKRFIAFKRLEQLKSNSYSD